MIPLLSSGNDKIKEQTRHIKLLCAELREDSQEIFALLSPQDQKSYQKDFDTAIRKTKKAEGSFGHSNSIRDFHMIFTTALGLTKLMERWSEAKEAEMIQALEYENKIPSREDLTRAIITLEKALSKEEMCMFQIARELA